jgi:hypothetical protein
MSEDFIAEKNRLELRLRTVGRRPEETTADGSCQYGSLAFMMKLLGISTDDLDTVKDNILQFLCDATLEVRFQLCCVRWLFQVCCCRRTLSCGLHRSHKQPTATSSSWIRLMKATPKNAGPNSFVARTDHDVVCMRTVAVVAWCS